MRIEVLFPEICNLYGELANVRYLRESLPDAEFVETPFTGQPVFLTEDVDLVYMGTMTEQAQVLISEKLMPYRDVIRNRIDDGMNFLITGNALEVFGKRILEDGKHICDGLGIFDFESRRDKRKRYNCIYVGEFDSGEGIMKVVGYKSLFGFAYGNAFKEHAFLNTTLGYGINKEISEEGIYVNNFIATYITGPLLVLNPPLLEWIMREKLGVEDRKPAFYDDAMKAYEYRVEEYTRPGKGWEY